MPPSSDKHVLAVDLGTSGPKAALVNLAGDIVAKGRASVETLILPEHGYEQDPERVWQAVRETCREVVSKSGVPREQIVAVACSSQYSSIVPVDKEGRPTMNMMLWLDQRGAKRKLAGQNGFPASADGPLAMLAWLRIHGLPPVGYGSESLSHMRWVKFAQPEVYARTHKFLEPMDYLVLRLTGRFVATQCTVVMSLLTDNRKLHVTEYHPRLVKQSLIDLEKLPELLLPEAVVGKLKPDVAADLGLSPETVVLTSINDTQAGGMATYAFSGNHGAVSVGSTSVIITHVPFKRTDIRHAILSMPSPVPRTYFVMAENGVAGGALEHFVRNIVFARDEFGDLGERDEFEALNRAVRSVAPGSNQVLFLPWMGGSIAPAADARMRGGFLNLSMQTTRAHMARAVLEGVAMNLRWLKGPTERFAKRRFTHFLYYGGGAESDEWSQIMADVLEVPVHQMTDPQYATCSGVALLAFERLGLLKLSDFAERVRIKAVFEPRRETKATYDALFRQFVAAFKANRGIFRSLNAVER